MQENGFDIIIGNPPYIQLQKNEGELSKLYKNKNFKTFDGTGDIYVLFYEKGINLLRDFGYLCFITSNKWMRTRYGEKLRNFFLEYNPKLLIDLKVNIFKNAIVDTNILLIQKTINQNKLRAVEINKTKKDGIDFYKIIENESVELNNLSKEIWFIGNSEEQRLKEKIERIGKPLKDWDINIRMGIITGLNEAFIISTEKRSEILANCKTEEERKRTEAVIKPILKGRDIKRYYYEWAGLWVIIIPAGWTNENREKHKAEEFIQEQFPSLMRHLKIFEEKAKKRNSHGNYWWELQTSTYYTEFEKEKVVYSDIVRQPQFYYDTEKFYVESTSFLMTGNLIKYICGLLNSNPVSYFFKKWYAGGGLSEKYYRYKKGFLKNLRIPSISPSNEHIVKQIESLVDKIIAEKRENKNANTSNLEREIDNLVYKLYDLSKEEIRIIEENMN